MSTSGSISSFQVEAVLIAQYRMLAVSPTQLRWVAEKNVMLQSLSLDPVRIDPSRVLPPVLFPLVHAAEQGLDLIPEIESITRYFKFDSFMYGVATNPRPDHESCIYAFTTLPIEWVMRYDQMAYVEIDPRVSGC